jgi:hypothetical protein
MQIASAHKVRSLSLSRRCRRPEVRFAPTVVLKTSVMLCFEDRSRCSNSTSILSLSVGSPQTQERALYWASLKEVCLIRQRNCELFREMAAGRAVGFPHVRHQAGDTGTAFFATLFLIGRAIQRTEMGRVALSIEPVRL